MTHHLAYALIALGLAACGTVLDSPDGGVDPDAAPADDGGGGGDDAGDDPDAAPPDAGPSGPPNIMFLTSSVTNGNMGGLAGADAICAERAAAGGLAGTYVAWLSSSTANAIDRLGGARGWVRPDGKPIADTAAELAAGRLYYPPRLDERGNDHGGEAYARTSTTIGGVLDDSPDTCGDWTSDTGTEDGSAYGHADSPTTMFTHQGSLPCDFEAPLYCLGIDNVSRVEAPQAVGRLAFVSSDEWLPGGGLGSADALCQDDADAAGLSGTYRAMLAPSGSSMASRFDTGGARWVRPDGAAITATAAELFTTEVFDTAISITADGTGNLANYLLWSGADTGSMLGTLATTCQGWGATTAGSSARAGITGRSSVGATFGYDYQTAACNTTIARIICLQE